MFFAASASFHGYYTASQFHEVGTPGGWYGIDFEQLVDGTAYRPYIYRQFLPMTANYLDEIVPRSVKSGLYAREMMVPATPLLVVLTVSSTAMKEQYFFRYLVVYIELFLFAQISTFAMYLVCREFGATRRNSVLASALMILLIPYFMRFAGATYDYVELALFAIAVWVTAKFRWWWMIPVAVLGAWNKESFFFFVPTLYPFMRRRNSGTSSLAGVGILCLICGAIYLALRVRYGHNLGDTADFQFPDQVRSFFSRPFLFSTEEAYGIRLPRCFSAIPLSLIVWAVYRSWRILPLEVRQHAKIAALINIPLFLLFCAPTEARDLSMLYMSLLLVIAVNLEQCFKDDDVRSLGEGARLSQTVP